jgi:hypothetical protein
MNTKLTIQANLSPWLAMWIRPRETIHQIAEFNPGYCVIPLAMFAGASLAIMSTNVLQELNTVSSLLLLLSRIVFGALYGLITLYFGGVVLHWLGKQLGGQARLVDVRAVIAWSSLPVITAGLLSLSVFWLFGESLWSGMALIQTIGAIWTFVIFLGSLSEVNRISARRTWSIVILSSVTLIGLSVIPIVALITMFLRLAQWL